MSGPAVLGLVCALYLLLELGAVPLGHAIGKRVGGGRILLMALAAGYLVYLAVTTYLQR